MDSYLELMHDSYDIDMIISYDRTNQLEKETAKNKEQFPFHEPLTEAPHG